jgi:hypothetical protein
MKCFNKYPGNYVMTRYFKLVILIIMVLSVVVSKGANEKAAPEVYVPYQDLPALIDPANKAILMEREQFEALLSAAKELPEEGPKLGQITNARYSAQIQNENVTLTGKLEVVSMSNDPVMIPLAFAQMGLNRVVMDNKPAPLGYNKQGRLVLIVASRGTHVLEIEAKTKLQELSSGGMQFSVSIPEATAGTLSLAAPGDLEIHSTCPLSKTAYDKQNDRTNVELIVGGQNKLTVILMGNGRQEDDKAILLGESATTIKLASNDQSLECLYTVQVLRRGVRQLQFRIPSEWTIMQVTCPSLVRWSIEPSNSGQPQILTVRLSTGKVGPVALHIQAAAARKNQNWLSPRIELVDADSQRGYLMINTDETLGVRGETLKSVRREDVAAASLVPGLDLNLGGRLYFHWGQDWSVNLELEEVSLRRSIKEQQKLVVSTQQVTLTGDFEITAVERELFTMTFVIRGMADKWQIRDVLVDRQQTGFEYRTETEGNRQLLKIELKKPVQPEKMTNVTIVLQNIPKNWDWPSNASLRQISVPLIESQAETVSGNVSVSAQGDLDAKPEKVPSELEEIPVARMVILGMEKQIQYAYSYKKSLQGEVALEITRRQPRVSCDSVGFVNVTSKDYSGDWRITYTISRASDKKIYILADKSIGQEIRITSPTVQISSKSIIPAESMPLQIADELKQQYDIWQLNLDNSILGAVVINTHYDRPITGKKFEVPLVRPVCDGQINEHLAIQASEELALDITPFAAKEIDAIDLPPLPVQANRILAAYQLEAATTPQGVKASAALETSVHKNYEIPGALVVSANLTTYLDAQLWQQTEANFQIANASRQFLTFRLPENAQLWSLSVNGTQSKPQRSTEGDYQVALGRLGGTVNVRIVYAYQPSDLSFDNTKLGAVELPGLKINQVNWNVVPPPDYSITSQKTNMQMLDIMRQRPAFLKIYEYIRRSRFSGISRFGALQKVRKQSRELSVAGDGKAAGFAQNERGYVGGGAYGGAMMGGGYGANGPGDRENIQFSVRGSPGIINGAAPQSGPTQTEGVPVTQQPGQMRGRGRGAQSQMARGGPQTQTDQDSFYFQQQINRQQQTDLNTSNMLIQTDAAQIPYQDLQGNPPQAAAEVQLVTLGTIAEGRYTLPVNLIPTPGAGRLARFMGLGASELVIGLSKQSGQNNSWMCGFVLMITIGLIMLLKKAKLGAAVPMGILLISSFLAVWWPSKTSFANGVFWGDIILIVLMLIIPVVKWLLTMAGLIENKKAVAAVVVLIFVSMPAIPAFAQQNAKPETIIVPYDTRPEQAENSKKVLVPYSRFVELWNRVHPQEPIDLPVPGTDISLADVKYDVTITKEQLNLVLTAEIRTFGRDWVTLPLPVSGLALTEAEYKGKTAQLQAAPNGMVLMLPGDSAGILKLKAIAKPQYLGEIGSIKFSLPPLPAAVMEVVLPQSELELEIDGLESPTVKSETGAENRWMAALGMTRELSMRWLPKLGNRAGDSTLSANSVHDVYAFHWSIIGVSTVTYSFAGGERDRFSILVPDDTTLTDIKGTNLRDYRQLGQTTLEGRTFKIIEARLHRAAKKQYELSIKWLSSLPIDKETGDELQLVRAGDVSRESGTVTLYSAGGMDIKVTDVTGGRRTTIDSDLNNTALNNQASRGGILNTISTQSESSDRAKPIARYYWPYRPFSVSVKFSRLEAIPKVNLDQLVRLNTDRIELVVQANLSAEQGMIFGASFLLPKDYELLSVVGPAVQDFYERSNSNGNFVHIEFDSGQVRTTAALVLVQNNAPPQDFNVPTITYIDSVGHEKSEQDGRLAVQVAASFEAQTISSTNLVGITPQVLQNWLNSEQSNLVQFAYRYEKPNPSLRLRINSKPTQIRAEVFAGLVVQATSADYTYRVRYNISGSPVDKLSFSLPSEYASLVAVESPILRSINRTDANDGRTSWTISLLNEVTGIVDVAVNFALPVENTTTGLSIPRLLPGAPEGQRTVVAVQNMSRHEIKIQDSNSLTVLPLSEQQTLMSSQMKESLQYVYQSFEKNWQMSLTLTQAKAAARIQAVVDLLALTTVVNRDGRCRYEVKVDLQNRSEQFLQVQVPKGLRLWSARVASQPVKPVMDTNSPEGLVLIPLVKTSPGGLPYDIVMYFADEGDKPLVSPLDGISKLSPPCISVVGIPITRTTWSLRLPDGYRYMRPGGNMSPIVGIVEALILSNEAKLEQLKRMDQSVKELAVKGKSAQVDTAKYNYDVLNTKIASEIQQTEQYLGSNRSNISSDEYERLRSNLDQQRQAQNVVVQGNIVFLEKQREQTSNNMNTWLNSSASNTGVAEIARNGEMNQMPGFVGDNGRQQLERLNRELAESQQLMLDNREDKNAPLNALADFGDKKAPSQFGKAAEELIVNESDKEGEMNKLLGELSKKTDSSLVQRQQQLQEQLSQMSSNRLERYTQSQQKSEISAEVAQKPAASPMTQSGQMSSGGMGGGMAMGGRGGRGAGAGGFGGGAMGGMDSTSTTARTDVSRRTGDMGNRDASEFPDAVSAAQPQFGFELNGQIAAGTSPAQQVDQLYTAQNVYSLPVSLPEGGGIQLDFARSSGQAQLSIWAVPEKTITNLITTLVIAGLSVLVYVIMKLWPKYAMKRTISKKAIVIYILLFVILTFLLGFLGLIISLLVIFINEGRHMVFA